MNVANEKRSLGSESVMAMSYEELLALNIAFLVLGAVAVFGNGTILMIIYRYPGIRQKECIWLILSLAVADLITGKWRLL